MENGLLYLFTTIAQCLAGAIALLAAFALYRMQSIAGAMATYCEFLIAEFRHIGRYNDVSELQGLQTEGRYDDFIAAHTRLSAATQSSGLHAPIDPRVAVWLDRLRANLAGHKTINAALWRALIATGLVMTGSIIATPAAHLIAYRPFPGWCAVAAGVLGFCICLWLYYALIRAALPGR